MKPLPPKPPQQPRGGARCKGTRTCGHPFVKGQACKVCQQRRRQMTGNAEVRHYEKTPNGFLMRAHRNIRSRTSGVQWKKAHLYRGLPACTREEFYAWSRDNADFWRLFRAWEAAGYPVKLSPSVNRINPNLGYTLDNMEWLTHSVNSALSRRASTQVVERIYATVCA